MTLLQSFCRLKSTFFFLSLCISLAPQADAKDRKSRSLHPSKSGEGSSLNLGTPGTPGKKTTKTEPKDSPLPVPKSTDFSTIKKKAWATYFGRPTEGGPEFIREFRNQLHQNWINVLLHKNRVFSVLVGTPGSKPDPAVARQLETLITTLDQQGIATLYEAESPYADLIRKLSPKLSVGISAQHDPQDISKGLSDGLDGTVAIENPYLRLKAFQRAEHIFVSHDSLSGLASLLNIPKHMGFGEHGYKHTVLIGEAGSPTNPFALWADKNGGELGAHLSSERIKKDPLKDLKEIAWKSRERTEGVHFDVETAIRSHSSWDMEKLYDAALKLVKMRKTLDSLPAPARGGAVIYGSGRGEAIHKYGKVTHQIATALSRRGINVVTGGSGGLMHVANDAAFRAGGESIGIHLREGTWVERDVPTDVHTHTFAAPDYTVRIPLLMHEREAYVIAPGGAGTLKEIATSLIELSARFADGRTQNIPALVLISKGYYQRLYDALMGLPISKEVKERLFLVDSAEEINQLIDQKKIFTGQYTPPAKGRDVVKPEPKPEPRMESSGRGGATPSRQAIYDAFGFEVERMVLTHNAEDVRFLKDAGFKSLSKFARDRLASGYEDTLALEILKKSNTPPFNHPELKKGNVLVALKAPKRLTSKLRSLCDVKYHHIFEDGTEGQIEMLVWDPKKKNNSSGGLTILRFEGKELEALLEPSKKDSLKKPKRKGGKKATSSVSPVQLAIHSLMGLKVRNEEVDVEKRDLPLVKRAKFLRLHEEMEYLFHSSDTLSTLFIEENLGDTPFFDLPKGDYIFGVKGPKAWIGLLKHLCGVRYESTFEESESGDIELIVYRPAHKKDNGFNGLMHIKYPKAKLTDYFKQFHAVLGGT